MKLDDKKIAVITCVNNEEMYKEACYFIEQQELPKSFSLEMLPIREARSITSGYNAAMEKNDAKYKIYIHQDVFVVYRKAIKEIIELFCVNKTIGLLGMIGGEKIQKNGCWWGSIACGAFIDGHTGYMEQNITKQEKPFIKAELLDGFFLATQYDIRWREDIFDGWHYYDASQCAEFLRRGYKIAVPYQEEAWCVHDCGVLYTYKHDYDIYQQRFIDEYGNDAALFK
jgi:hypothetical protein